MAAEEVDVEGLLGAGGAKALEHAHAAGELGVAELQLVGQLAGEGVVQVGVDDVVLGPDGPQVARLGLPDGSRQEQAEAERRREVVGQGKGAER